MQWICYLTTINTGIMKPDPKVSEEMHHRTQMSVPHVPIKDPKLSDIYHEVRNIRRWITIIGIVVIIGLIGAVISLFFII